VSYLNHGGTSGVPNVDYLLADHISAPPEMDVDGCFTEQIYRLAGSFCCFDYDRLSAPPVTAPPSLARGSVTFGCFANGAKINEQLISCWAALLNRVPHSTLFIKNAQLDALDDQRFMFDRFRRFGVDADRLRIERGTDRQSLLKCYADVDIALDTWPYCGINTTGEAFWQGVPVVTLSTPRLSARFGASLVTAAGCSDLVATSPQEYVEIAAKLASDSERLRRLRANLRTMVKQHGLGDSGRLARALDDAFAVMMTQHLSSRSDAHQQSAGESELRDLNRFGVPRSKMLAANAYDPSLFP
jgi:protein O-GlcNAc transferase